MAASHSFFPGLDRHALAFSRAPRPSDARGNAGQHRQHDRRDGRRDGRNPDERDR